MGFTETDLQAVADEYRIGDPEALQSRANEILDSVEKQNGKMGGKAALTKAAREMSKALVVSDNGSDPAPAHAMAVSEYTRTLTVIDPEKDFYMNSQTKRKTLNKRGLDKIAFSMGINTEIRDMTITNEMVIVKVRGWIGPRDDPVVETEDMADYVFRDKQEDFIFKTISERKVKEDEVEIREDGKLYYKDNLRNIRMRRELLREKEFAPRATASKARERVIRALSGMCDMTSQEARMLKEEWLSIVRKKRG